DKMSWLNVRRKSVMGVIPALVLLMGIGTAEGATGMAFLKNGGDARSTMLGEAVVSRVEDISSCFWNPAGLARAVRPQLMLSHVESFADLRQEYVAALQPLGLVSAALFFNGQWSDDIEGYSAAGIREASFGYAAYATGVALGAPVGWGLCVGGTCKYLNESIAEYSASGWAADVGLQWSASDVSPLRFGIALQNLGPSMSFIEDSFDLPLTIQGGASWEILLESLSGCLLVAGEVRHVQDEGSALLAGAEYTYDGLLSLGFGYQGGRDTRDVSVGLGAHIGLLALHWAYVPISEDLGDENRFTVHLDL
ncbi:MAG: PorV/PorQ family protein, partial [Candidatus Eisenbacteria sp.]|nr:PorV/PorQ family protein [Candidatus Eisenbacteria bacterium]